LVARALGATIQHGVDKRGAVRGRLDCTDRKFYRMVLDSYYHTYQ